MSRAKTSHKPDQEPDSPVSDQDSGTAWQTPFARFNPDTSSSKTSLGSQPRWVPAQGSLLLEQLSLTWPKQGMWDLGYAYELPTSERPTSESESSLLLPTPNAYESTPTQEYVEEVQKNMDDPHKRLYLPGRKWHSQRTLSRIAPALLPTPSANDSTGSEGPTRKGRQESGKTGGPSLRDLPYLLPTPTSGDSRASGNRNLPGSKAKPGTSLTDAVVRNKLLPTPTVNDARNTGGPSQERRRSLPLTEIASDVSGGSTPRPSYVGKESLDEVHPDQLTIEGV